MGRDSSCMQAVAFGLIARTVPCRRNTFEDELKVETVWAIIISLNSVQSWCSCGVLRRRYTILVYFQTGKFKCLLNTLLPFFFLFDRDVEMLALFVACLCHDIDHRGTTNSFQVSSVREITVFVCFSGFVLLCAILFKLKICLFAFCFVFSFVYCSIAFPFLLFSGFNTGCAL